MLKKIGCIVLLSAMSLFAIECDYLEVDYVDYEYSKIKYTSEKKEAIISGVLNNKFYELDKKGLKNDDYLYEILLKEGFCGNEIFQNAMKTTNFTINLKHSNVNNTKVVYNTDTIKKACGL